MDENQSPIQGSQIPKEETLPSETPVSQAPIGSPLPFVIAAIVFVALLGAIGFVYMRSQQSPQSRSETATASPSAVSPSGSPSTATTGSVLSPTPTTKTTKGFIVKAVTAKGIDPKTGEAVNVSSAFSTKDPTIYVVASLSSVKPGTTISYTRYLKDVLLDHKTLTVTKPATNNVSFVWSLKKGTVRIAGTYTVKLYANGAYERSVTYTVK